MADEKKDIQRAEAQAVQPHHGDTSGSTDDRSAWTYRPNVDIIDSAQEYTVLADLPGADQDAIDVSFQDDVLSVQAPIEPRVSNVSQVYRHEYGIGGFHRRFVVEAPVDAEKMSAEYDNGVLAIHLPKAEKAKGRRIAVQSG